jgi:hypothetical protein
MYCSCTTDKNHDLQERVHLYLTKSAKGPERASHSAITSGRRRYNRLIYESLKSGCGFSPTTPYGAIVDFYYEYRTATLSGIEWATV